VERHGPRPDAVLGQVPPRLPVELTRVEQRLGRDTADAETSAAEGGRLLHRGHPHAELGGADRGDVAAGTRPDYHEVVRRVVGHRRHTWSSMRTGSSSRSLTRTRNVTAC